MPKAGSLVAHLKSRPRSNHLRASIFISVKVVLTDGISVLNISGSTRALLATKKGLRCDGVCKGRS